MAGLPSSPEPPASDGTPSPGLVAWLDVSAGVAGDMLLGALLDAGADPGAVQRAVDAVLPGAVRVAVSEVHRAGMRALRAEIRPLATDHPHRAWRDIRTLLGSADLPEPVRETATETFSRLAAVEADVHGTRVDDVEFHEVGAWDSVADVVGCCAAVHALGVTQVVASRLAVGSGTVRTAHGELPVPVPAVLGMLEGWTVLSGGHGELATPTGVALLTTLASAQGDLPSLRVVGSGLGAGARDPSGRANVVRVVLGHPDSPHLSADSVNPAERMVLLEANVDDLDPRVWPTVLTELLRAGAADAWLAPIVMKKGRPAHTLSVLCAVADAPTLRGRIVDLTSTIGVRQTAVDRWALERGWTDVDVDGCPVAVKVAHRDGAIVQATPEFEDVAAAAAVLGRPVRDVLAAANAAAASAALARGRAVPPGLRHSHTRLESG